MVDVEARRPRTRWRRARVSLIVLAGIIPIVPIVIGAAFLGSSVTRPAAGSIMLPFGGVPNDDVPRLTRTPPRGLSRPNPGYEVAVVTRATTIHSTPGGPEIAPQPTVTPFGSQVVYAVREVQGDWLGVLSPLAGNGRLGWIPASSAILNTVDWKLVISLARRRLTVFRDGKVVKAFSIAIGRPTAPTPTGTFAVTDRLSTGDPAGPYGCCILALSALAPHEISDWDGGNRIAIHSTPPDTYWSIGEPVTHGCMHVTLPEGRWLLDNIPLGTPAIVRSD